MEDEFRWKEEKIKHRERKGKRNGENMAIGPMLGEKERRWKRE